MKKIISLLLIALMMTTCMVPALASAPAIGLSATAVGLNWGRGNEATITVSSPTPISTEILYGVGGTGWLTCFLSGNALTVMPTSANTSSARRTAYVVINNGKADSAILSVTQNACGEAVTAWPNTSIAVAQSRETAQGQALADYAASMVGREKTSLNPAWKNRDWCGLFVSHCARQLGLPVFADGGIANPESMLTAGQVYYYYAQNGLYTQTFNDVPATWSMAKWRSSKGGDMNSYMNNSGFTAVFDPMRAYQPVAGDLVFFKTSNSKGNLPWAHVGIVTSYSNGQITFVDGNNHGNGSAGTDYGSAYVNRRTTSISDKLLMAVVHPNYAY